MVSTKFIFSQCFLVSTLICSIISTSHTDEHPRYTAARLADIWKHILEGEVSISDSKLIENDVVYDNCGSIEGYDVLVKQLEELIPKIASVQITVKFAYHIPFANNSIQFTMDEGLTMKDGTVKQTEKAMFARLNSPDDEKSDYQIYEARTISC